MGKHFQPFKHHPAVKLAAKLRRTRGVSFDAPMGLAVHLAGPPGLEEQVPFDPHPEALDGRWRLDEVRAFVREARAFARETRFMEFFEAQRGLYELATARMKKTMAQHARLEWFDQFFGQRAGASFHVLLGMLNGPSCYGPRLSTEGKSQMYCILGVWVCDQQGAPDFPEAVLPTVVHEFNHSYINPLVDRHAAGFEKAGKALYQRVRDSMRRQAYGNWQTMMRESLVRACVVRYRLANEGQSAAAGQVRQQHGRGFAWTGELSALLGEYEAQRDRYPTLDAFMPRIVEFFDGYAARQPETRPRWPWSLLPSASQPGSGPATAPKEQAP